MGAMILIDRFAAPAGGPAVVLTGTCSAQSKRTAHSCLAGRSCHPLSGCGGRDHQQCMELAHLPCAGRDICGHGALLLAKLSSKTTPAVVLRLICIVVVAVGWSTLPPRQDDEEANRHEGQAA